MNGEYHVVVIGGGATGAGTALDLLLRGINVTLVERAELNSGTSGRYHGLLHSGARYAVTDPESARECAAENPILKRILPHAIEDTGGLFVTTPDDDPAYADTWLEACHAVGIDAREIPVAEALAREPALNHRIQRAFTVPDAVCNSGPVLSSLAQAIELQDGLLYTQQDVIDVPRRQGRVAGVVVRDAHTGAESEMAADLVVNAAGPWAGGVAALAGIELLIHPNRGTMVAVAGRLVNTVINRLRRPGDGDIIVPLGPTAVIGTTSVDVADPDDTTVDETEVRKMLEAGDLLVPGFRDTPISRAWAGVRPLYEESTREVGRAVTRTFDVLDHGARDGVPGLVTVVGGKFTTYRLMAEQTADLVAQLLGVDAPSRTEHFALGTQGPAMPRIT